jgi:hypothetical protein
MATVARRTVLQRVLDDELRRGSVCAEETDKNGLGGGGNTPLQTAKVEAALQCCIAQ